MSLIWSWGRQLIDNYQMIDERSNYQNCWKGSIFLTFLMKMIWWMSSVLRKSKNIKIVLENKLKSFINLLNKFIDLTWWCINPVRGYKSTDWNNTEGTIARRKVSILVIDSQNSIAHFMLMQQDARQTREDFNFERAFKKAAWQLSSSNKKNKVWAHFRIDAENANLKWEPVFCVKNRFRSKFRKQR